MIITISGTPGAGKSTVANILSKDLKMDRFSVGDFRGIAAKKRGLTIDEYNSLGEKEDFTDKDADSFQEDLGKTKDNFIIDGRLSFHFIPNSFKIFLKCDLEVGAERIFHDQDNRDDEKTYEAQEEVIEALHARMNSDKARYKKYYDLDPFLEEHYDLVIDTTTIDAQKATEKIKQVLTS